MPAALGTMVVNGLGVIPNVTPGTPVQLTATPTMVKQIFLSPFKATGAANTGNVYIGGSNMNRVTGVGVLAILRATDPTLKILRGDSMDCSAIDLSSLYMDANTAADAVYVGYVE